VKSFLNKRAAVFRDSLAADPPVHFAEPDVARDRVAAEHPLNPMDKPNRCALR
jgi:hypothetical protein